MGAGFDDEDRPYVATHAGAYAASAAYELVALVDIDPERARRYADRFGAAAYSDVDELFAQEQLDVVSIATPNATHRNLVAAAAGAGLRGILCEKPIANTLREADEMIELCAASGTVLLIDHQRRFDAFHRAVAAALHSGELGDVQAATAYYTAGLANTGTHMLDLLRLLLGDASWVSGRPSGALAADPADPNVDGMIGFAGGVTATLQALDVAAYTIFEVNVLTTRGRFRIGSHGFAAEWEEAVPSERFLGYRELRRERPPVEPDGPPEFALQAVEHLRQCVEEGAEPLSGGVDGRKALELIYALRESADDDGRTVLLPLTEAFASA